MPFSVDIISVLSLWFLRLLSIFLLTKRKHLLRMWTESSIMKRLHKFQPTTEDERILFVLLWRCGLTARDISQKSGVSVTTVCRWLRRWRYEGSVSTRPRARRSYYFHLKNYDQLQHDSVHGLYPGRVNNSMITQAAGSKSCCQSLCMATEVSDLNLTNWYFKSYLMMRTNQGDYNLNANDVFPAISKTCNYLYHRLGLI